VSSAYVPAELRRRIRTRARRFCEYCLIHEDDTDFGCEPDHIISIKHGGSSTEENLALACLPCNRWKGSDIGSLVHDQFTRFYNPRTDRWFEHFELEPEGARISALTEIGMATVRILGFNLPARLDERSRLRTIGRYPLPGALLRIEIEEPAG